MKICFVSLLPTFKKKKIYLNANFQYTTTHLFYILLNTVSWQNNTKLIKYWFTLFMSIRTWCTTLRNEIPIMTLLILLQDNSNIYIYTEFYNMLYNKQASRATHQPNSLKYMYKCCQAQRGFKILGKKRWRPLAKSCKMKAVSWRP